MYGSFGLNEVNTIQMTKIKFRFYGGLNFYQICLGQVEKPRVQPGKTVPRELPRDSFSWLPEAFPQLVRLCYPVGQSWTLKPLKKS